MAEDIARGIRARALRLPSNMVKGYSLGDIVPSTLREETPPPPKLYEPDQNSTAGIDPASDTGQALLGNCQRIKTMGQLLSGGLDIDDTAGSDEEKIEKDLSRVKALLRLHGQPA